MTCFWNAIISKLNKDDYKLLGIKPIKRSITDLKFFINRLKELSFDAEFNILWQGNELLDKEKKDLKEFIKGYNINDIQKGHLTSSCDPFLCLLSDILRYKIIFNYRKSRIIFEPKNEIRRDIRFNGSSSHFS